MPEPARPPEPPEGAARPAPVADERYGGSLASAAAPGGGSTFGGPPVGQFGGPPSQFGGPPSQFGGPPAPNPYAPPSTTFGAPPVAPPFGAPVGGFGAPPAAGWAPAPARSGLPRWALALIVGVAGFVAVCIVAAVVIPVFLAQRDKSTWAHTTFAMPGDVEGLPRITGPTVDQLSSLVSLPEWGDSGFEAPQVGVYGQPGHPSEIVIAAHSTKPLLASSRAAGIKVVMAHPAQGMSGWDRVDAGRRGGDMVCGDALLPTTTLTLCTVIDPAGVLVIATVTGGDAAVKEAQAVREAVEQHR